MMTSNEFIHTTPPRVLIYGSVSPATGGWCYAQAFARAGSPVQTVPDIIGLEKYRSFLPLRIYSRLTRRIRECDRLEHVNRLRLAIQEFRPDILMVLGGQQLSKDDIRSVQSDGIWAINVNHDDFFSQYRANWTWTQRDAIPAYDYILTTRTCNVEEVRPRNANVAFLPFAYDPSIHRVVPIPDNERDKWNADVVFVGQWAAQRGALIEQLVRAVPAKYAIRGPGWDRVRKSSPVRPFVHPTHVWGDEMAKAVGGAKIALGFLRKENRDDYTQRTFEIPACGGLLLAERTAMHLSIFKEGIEAEFFDANQPDELIRKVRKLLADNNNRESIRKAGMLAVERGSYTYDHRIRQILNLYSKRTPLLPLTQPSSVGHP